MRLPRPPFAVAGPALTYLAIEAGLLAVEPIAPRLLRFTLAALLVAGVLYEHRIAIPLWMFCCAFGALLLFSRAFRAAPSSFALGGAYCIAAGAALANAGYLFFFHRGRNAAHHGGD